jgi:uncharacterized membrane protein
MIVFMALFIFMLEWREQKREIRNLDSSERHKLSNMRESYAHNDQTMRGYDGFTNQ